MERTSVEEVPTTGFRGNTRADSFLRRVTGPHSSLRVHGVTLGIAIPIALLSWPRRSPVVDYGVDASWNVSLQVAADDGLAFGHDVNFTYGPLGFLARGDFFLGGPGQLALGAQALAWVALAFFVVAAIRTLVRPVVLQVMVSLAILLVVSATPQSYEWIGLALPVFATVCVAELSRPEQQWPIVKVAMFAALGALLFFVKGNVGIAIWAIGGLTVALGSLLEHGVGRSLRNCAIFLASAAVSVPVLWIAIGQPIGALPTWVRSYLEFVTGYSDAMGDTFAAADRSWLVPAVIAFPILFVVIVMTTGRMSLAQRLSMSTVVLVTSFSAFKIDFTRHVGTDRYFLVFVALPLGFVAAPFAVRSSVSLVALVCLSLVAALTLSGVTDIGGHLRSFRTGANLMVSRDARDERIAEQRRGLARGLQIAPIVLDRVGDKTVHAVPIDAAAVYIYPELRWQPLPVFQDYAAYTERLDEVNAQALVSDHRPDFVIRRKGFGLDGRVPRFDPPGANLALLCNYRLIIDGGGTELLEAAGDRCGRPRSLGRRSVRMGQHVSVPDPTGGFLVARVAGVNRSLGARVESLLLRGRKVFVSPDTDQWFRFLPGTQGSWHVLRAPDCLSAELANTGPQFRSFTLSDAPGQTDSSDDYTIEFARVPVDCPS